ncbi:hypothetical protein DMN91_005276 [Ooceraea biroi]|uniref:Peptidase S1 domain-containing protein n=1 Tax=Ooceraea biroi TaxID=2015173 RepID=A0A3L8DTA9_OOCBI|nr:hypothetical protein DMN91_005276 [Ooceraea biroi]
MRPRRKYHWFILPTNMFSSLASNCSHWLPRWLQSANSLLGMITDDAVTILQILIVLLVLGHAIAADNLNENNTLASGDINFSHSVNQSFAMEHLSRTALTKLSHFTSWSEWSVCNRHCTQNRVRKCRWKKNCGTTVLKEERSCDHDREARQKRCKQHQRRGHQRWNKQFHVVQQIAKETKPKQGKQRGKNTKEPITFGRHYGKWSKWSPCTRLCTTQRHRWCKRPNICGRDVIRESAYCYVEGTFCQKWIHRKIRGSHKEDSEDRLVLKKLQLNPNIVGNFIAEKNSNAWKCGIANTQKNSRLSYFTRIIGGRPATHGSWPWQVAILNRFREAFCGGTLVSPRWVLTAAHCIRKRLYVRIGEHDLTIKEGTELELRIDSVTIHPKYDADTVDNDVALLRLPNALTMSASRGIACLPSPKQPIPMNQFCTIIGWGKSSVTDDFGTDVLHEARVPIVSTEICREVYVEYKITDNMFCAGYRRGKMDSCAGDSGGPLLCRDYQKPDQPWTIFGITSFGEGCGKRGKFGIYAKLSNYVNWITRVMKQMDELT